MTKITNLPALAKSYNSNLKTSIFTLILALTFFSVSVSAQTVSPYKTSLKKDGSAIAAGVGLSYLGLTLIKNKSSFSSEEINSLSKDDVFFLDKGTAGNFSHRADKDSYIPFYASFAAVPVIMLLNKNERSKAGQVLVLFTESMAVTGAIYSLTAGSVKRSRPFAYNTSVPIEDRMDNDAHRSFFAGHTAATATATFFAAKVFSDFNPDSKLKPYVWAAAALVPATVGYLRLKSGMHFLSDNLLGYAIGAGSGILIPQLHKSKLKNVDIAPAMGMNYQGLNIKYTFISKHQE